MNFEDRIGISEEERAALDFILDSPQAFDSQKTLEKLKRQVAIDFALSRYLSNTHLIARARERKIRPNEHAWLSRLTKKPARSLSGVSIVAVMIPPENSCPFDCAYCPQGVNAPRSYTGHEPSTLRAIGHNYDSFEITRHRIAQLRAMGHAANKIHVVVQGGTFLALPAVRQDSVMKGIYDGILAVDATEKYQDPLLRPSSSLQEAMALCESAPTKNVGTTFETRPDVCSPHHVDRMLDMGGTWVEIGVQTLSDEIYAKVDRKHTVSQVKEAIAVARDAGFKINVHMMPNLLSTPEMDKQMFIELFNNPDFRPDGLKIYPLLIIPGTKLYDQWKEGRLDPLPYTDTELIRTLAEIKRDLPSYTRIHRIQRDIPSKYVAGGLLTGNLRNLVKEMMQAQGWQCRCIRCREIGHVMNLTLYKPRDHIELKETSYEANEGMEWFLSYVDPVSEVLFGFIRIRYPSKKAHRSEVMSNAAIVRELHVYGQEVPTGEGPTRLVHAQHRGLGKKLLTRGEELAVASGYQFMTIISGIGVREYYRKLGYEANGPYMAKRLSS